MNKLWKSENALKEEYDSKNYIGMPVRMQSQNQEKLMYISKVPLL